MSGKQTDKVCLSKAETGKARTIETKPTTAVVSYGGSAITVKHWASIGTACGGVVKLESAIGRMNGNNRA